MPSLPPDIALIVEMLNTPVKHALEGQEMLRQEVTVLKTTQAEQREQIRGMTDEIADLKKELRETKQAIIDNNNANYKRVIYVQGSILLLILSAVISLAVKVFFH